jgi:hypothetical protein
MVTAGAKCVGYMRIQAERDFSRVEGIQIEMVEEIAKDGSRKYRCPIAWVTQKGLV